jgi:hypothetical protein
MPLNPPTPRRSCICSANRRGGLPGLLLTAMLFLAHGAAAQITPADTLGINYPGWESADQVAPRITVETSYDSVSGLWTYRYTIANDTSARQAIWDIRFGVDPVAAPSAPLTVTVPAGWRGLIFPYSPRTFLPGVVFFALFADDSLGPASGPPPARILPGGSLSDFMVTSPYPPGYARSYVQGYVNLPAVEDAGDVYTPTDTTNSQRGIVIFPNQLLLASGAAIVGEARLVEARIPASGGKVLSHTTPARAVAVAIRLAPGGGRADAATFRAMLNGVDVTRDFHPARAGGADLAAAFTLGRSPLVAGENRLVVTVAGVRAGTARRVTDTGELRFRVRP